MFNLPLYATDSSGFESLLTPAELQRQIELILHHTDEEPVYNPAIFTTLTRPEWTRVCLNTSCKVAVHLLSKLPLKIKFFVLKNNNENIRKRQREFQYFCSFSPLLRCQFANIL